jgi:N-glycosylase/DNA lyase
MGVYKFYRGSVFVSKTILISLKCLLIMDEIIAAVKKLQNGPVKDIVESRLIEFSAMQKASDKEWFSELCFCLLTANTSAELGLRMQKELGYEGFTKNKSEEELALRLKDAKYRFYNRRACFIYLANQHKSLKNILLGQPDKRAWLVENIKGIGWKEASHFLRNVGYLDYAILDKHILNLMAEHGLIVRPKTLNKTRYEAIEKVFYDLSSKAGIKPGELDMYMWYMKTGKVLK